MRLKQYRVGGLIWMLIMSSFGMASEVHAYELSKELTMPGSSVRQTDSFNDGRLIVYSSGTLYIEQAANVGLFDPIALNISGNASSMKLAPDQQRVALGTGDDVNICLLSTGICEVFAKPNFQFEWIDNRYLLVTASPQIGTNYVNTLEILDTDSADAMNPNSQTLIDLHGVQAGVTLDFDENLIVAIYSSGEGHLYAFDQAAWTAAWLSETILTAGDGVFLGSALSGAYLGFDSWGDLLVGGGNGNGDPVALVIKKEFIDEIKLGLSPPFDAAINNFSQLEPPIPCTVNFTQIHASISRQELYVTCYSNDQLRVYKKEDLQVPLPWQFVFILFVSMVGVQSLSSGDGIKSRHLFKVNKLNS